MPLLLTAARAVSEERHWDVLHALRVAGLAA
ncbi:UL36 very large tegument protein OS=Streptomyces albaduncus OX=68172 GN=FHS32_002905 PE=4 SV=1 [Streptomyces griseoloalbus]